MVQRRTPPGVSTRVKTAAAIHNQALGQLVRRRGIGCARRLFGLARRWCFEDKSVVLLALSNFRHALGRNATMWHWDVDVGDERCPPVCVFGVSARAAAQLFSVRRRFSARGG